MAEPTQGSPENYKGQYASLKFPRYEHREYPKLLYKDEERKVVLGTAHNAMEEKALYESIGVAKADIDPMGAALDEISVLRAKLAQYEGEDPAQQLPAKTSGVKTATVEMLPESAPAPAPEKPTNPLLKPAVQPTGKPLPIGSAPQMGKDAAKAGA